MIALQRFSERACGPAFVLYGVVAAVLSVVHPDQLSPGALANPLWVPVHALGALDTLPELVGWLGVLGVYGNRLSVPLRIALMVVLIGVVVECADQLVEMFLPFEARDAAQQTVVDVRNDVDPGYALITLVELGNTLALAIISFSFLRLNIPPRSAWLGLFLLVVPGSILAIVVAGAFPDLAWPAVTLLSVALSAVFTWIGISIGRPALPSGSARRLSDA